MIRSVLIAMLYDCNWHMYCLMYCILHLLDSASIVLATSSCFAFFKSLDDPFKVVVYDDKYAYFGPDEFNSWVPSFVCMENTPTVIKTMSRDIDSAASEQLIIGFPFGRLPNTWHQPYRLALDKSSGMCATRLSHWSIGNTAEIATLYFWNIMTHLLCILHDIVFDDLAMLESRASLDIGFT